MKRNWADVLPFFLRQRVEGSPYLQSVVGNTVWLFIEKLIRIGVGLFVGVWVARFLGPERFGSLSYALAFVSLFSAIAGLGLDGIVVRDIVREPSRRDEILGTAFFMKLTGGVAAFGVALAAVRLVRPGDPLSLSLVGILAAGMIFNAFDTIDFAFQAQVRSKFVVVAKSVAFLLVSIGKVVLILTDSPLVAFAWAGLAEIAIGSAGMVAAYRNSGQRIGSWRYASPRAWRMFRDSWPLILSGIAIMVYMRIDQVMIGEMVGAGEVGVYSVAVLLVEAWYFLPMIVLSSFFPGIVDAKESDEPLFYERLQMLYNLMALMAYAIAVPVTLASGWIIGILYGAAYAKAAPMLAVLVWSLLFTNLGVARSAFLTAKNWTRVHFLTVVLGAMLNVLLNYLLIPPYGGMGAVIASCAAYWFAAHGSCFVYAPLKPTGRMLTRAMICPRIW